MTHSGKCYVKTDPSSETIIDRYFEMVSLNNSG